ncbi:MAG: propanoyl-CoA acyltransferase [Gammaproteobacteria bacterium]|nr:MAG: propanoyl-CoA acyltransferase [Gammaproteobacteria bacterium]RKZ72102.1 MAG: propanoyl-CoA acyltransferase [Gammaproteobacteria bacterium]
MNISMVGAHNTQFGAFVKRDRETGEVEDLKSFYELIVEAGAGAIADAGLEAKDIDAIWLGSCSPSLFVNQEHVGPLALEIDPVELLYKPTTRTEGACATSSLAIYNAAYAVGSGRFKNVLAIGVEKMSLLDTKGVTHALACSSYWPDEGSKGVTFPGLFGEMAQAYQKKHQLSDEELRIMLAHISAQNYRNGIQNPMAHFGPGSVPDKLQLVTAEAILDLPDSGRGSNMMIAPPLRLHDCSLISDGAAAVVLTSTENAKSSFDHAVELSGIGHVTQRMMMSERKESLHELQAAKHAVQLACSEAGVQVSDMDLAEVHDCFTINQMLCVEAMGLSEPGRSGYEFMEGKYDVDGDCPINLSGGLKSKGHPVGATGASMHALAYKQLTGSPIGVAAKGQPELAMTVNIGGSGVTNCVSVLRRIQ